MNLKHFESLLELLELKDRFGYVIMQDGKKVIKTFSGKIIPHLYRDGEYLVASDSVRSLLYHTCDGRCEVGKPDTECRVFKKGECGMVNAAPSDGGQRFTISVDDISKLIERNSISPVRQRVKLIVIDEKHLAHVLPDGKQAQCFDNNWTVMTIKNKNTRLASAADFERFKISFKGFDNPDEYEFDPTSN